MYLFIVNPSAGKGKAITYWPKIDKLLQERQIQFDVLTSHSEQATKDFITSRLNYKPISAVVVIGGDGTTSSVIQYLAELDIPIAIFPTGSGNDTARMLRLTNIPSLFVSSLLAGRMTTFDLIRANDRFGITIAGVGIDSIIGSRVNQSFYKPLLNKIKLGSFTYIIAAIFSLLTFKPFTTRLSIDGERCTLQKNWLIACGNTVSYGGGLTICPQALPTDGILNMTILHDVSRVKILFHLFPLLFRGRPIFKKGVTYKTGKEIEIETDRPVPAILDGEIYTSTPLKITIHEKALKIILTN